MNKDKILSALAAIGITAIAALFMAMLSAETLEVYGSGIFIVTPMVCGAISVLVYNRKGNQRLGESVLVSLITGGMTLLGFMVVGFEGLICIAMSVPIVLPLFIVGGLLAYPLSRALARKLYSDLTTLLLIAFVPLFMGFESQQRQTPKTRSVTTTVIIEGKIGEVWKEVIEFSPIPEPDEFLFRIGIAYPTHAEIKGEGVGAIRYCNFSTGSFVEPITHWEENERLAFDVTEQPTPMTEISPYVGIHPPHLDWAIRSEKGEFRLKNLGDGRIELTGTTWFHTVMEPQPYWGWLSDYMIHAIHRRVLNHIKQTVEE